MTDIPAMGALLPDVLEAMSGHAERWPVVRTGEREPISRTVRLLVWRRDDGQCRLCSTRTSPVELDHIVPWSAGGADDSTNLRVLCQSCNQARSNYRLGEPIPAQPVVMCCESCLRVLHHHNPGRRCRYFPLCLVCGTAGSELASVYCGTCRSHDATADSRRLL
jgi:HNH endonuclease